MKNNPFSSFNPQDRFMVYLTVVIIISVTLVGAVVLTINIEQKIHDANYFSNKNSATVTMDDANNLAPAAAVSPVGAAATNTNSTSLEPVSD